MSTAPAGSGPNFTDELSPGEQAGPWTVERELGRGGMGVVYAVIHEKIGKRAALKVLHRSLLVPGFNPERMVLEGRAVNEIGHPNIVDIFEAGALPDGRPYIVMERLDGRSLAERVETEITTEEVFAVLRQVCDALIAAHAAGVVHRDLKLDNIFLTDAVDEQGAPRVKLLDWGIARMIHIDARHTMEGQLVGTPQYVSPEQARGAEVTVQTDVYSLGVVAYELFVGQLPFQAQSAAEMMAQHLLVPPAPPRTFWPRIPPKLEELLLAMLAKQPEARPPIAEVARRLEAARVEYHDRGGAAADADAVDPDDSVIELRKRTRKKWPVVVGGLALLGGAGLFLVAREPTDPERPDVPAPAQSSVEPQPSSAPVRPAPPAPTPASFVPPPAASSAPAARPAPVIVPVEAAHALVNPVHDSCADPAIARDGKRWVMTCTGGWDGNRFPVHQSTDLQKWTRTSWIFPQAAHPVWANGHAWAPELHPTRDGALALFSMRGPEGKNAIGAATASSMKGPFTDLGAPLLAPRAGASDAHLFVDTSARYLYYRLDDAPSSIWAQPLRDDRLEVEGESRQLLAATEAWEDGVVEAPWLVKHGNYYYLLYSGGRYCGTGYAIGVARSKSPLGPFEKKRRPLLATGGEWAGPGHTTVTSGRDGQLLVAYHAYRLAEGTPTCEANQSADNNRRQALIAPLRFEGGWPRIVSG